MFGANVVVARLGYDERLCVFVLAMADAVEYLEAIDSACHVVTRRIVLFGIGQNRHQTFPPMTNADCCIAILGGYPPPMETKECGLAWLTTDDGKI